MLVTVWQIPQCDTRRIGQELAPFAVVSGCSLSFLASSFDPVKANRDVWLCSSVEPSNPSFSSVDIFSRNWDNEGYKRRSCLLYAIFFLSKIVATHRKNIAIHSFSVKKREGPPEHWRDPRAPSPRCLRALSIIFPLTSVSRSLPCIGTAEAHEKPLERRGSPKKPVPKHGRAVSARPGRVTPSACPCRHQVGANAAGLGYPVGRAAVAGNPSNNHQPPPRRPAQAGPASPALS